MKHWCANCRSGFWVWGETPPSPLLCPSCKSRVDAAGAAVAKHKRRKPTSSPNSDSKPPNRKKDKVSDGTGSSS